MVALLLLLVAAGLPTPKFEKVEVVVVAGRAPKSELEPAGALPPPPPKAPPKGEAGLPAVPAAVAREPKPPLLL